MKRLALLAFILGLALTTTPIEAQTPTPTGSIRIAVDTSPETTDLDICFDAERDGPGDPSDFCLEDDESRTRNLEPGEYTYTVDVPDGWVLDNIACTPRRSVDIDEDELAGQVIIDLEAGDEVSCEFRFTKAPTPTATVTPTATATPSPVPTATPSPVTPPAALQTPVVVNNFIDVFVPSAPAAVPTLPPAIAPPAAVIRPPATGNAGLLCEESGGVYSKDGPIASCAYPVGNSDNTKVDDQKGSFNSSHPQGYTNPGGSKPPGQQE